MHELIQYLGIGGPTAFIGAAIGGIIGYNMAESEKAEIGLRAAALGALIGAALAAAGYVAF